MTTRLALFAVLLVSIASAAARADGALVTHPIGTTGAPYGYVEYLPPGYDAAPDRRFPIVVVLHGIGETGDGSDPYEPCTGNGPLRDIKDALARGEVPALAAREAIFVAPQSPSWWSASTLDAFFDYLEGAYRVDPDRVYLTGLSMGGGGTWSYAAAHADRLAAIVPVCPAGTGAPSAAAMLRTLPVRAYHAFDDGTVSRSETASWMDAIAIVRGAASSDVLAIYPHEDGESWRPAVEDLTAIFADGAYTWQPGTTVESDVALSWTLYRGGQHWIWGRVYGDAAMWDWLFAQRRGSEPPPVDAGPPDADAGTSDAGAGALDPDAGTPIEPAADAAAPADAGASPSPAPGTLAGGCQCTAAPRPAPAPPPFALAAVALLAALRRCRSSRGARSSPTRPVPSSLGGHS